MLFVQLVRRPADSWQKIKNKHSATDRITIKSHQCTNGVRKVIEQNIIHISSNTCNLYNSLIYLLHVDKTRDTKRA